jgi:hypothetical protein
VTVRMQSALFAVIAIAASGIVQSPITSAEPIRPLGTARLSDLRAAGLSGWKMTPVSLAGAAGKAAASRVAIATAPLDLSKLTMSDFGDVDPSH